MSNTDALFRKGVLDLLALIQGGRKRYSELEKEVNISPSTLVQRIKTLEKSGLIERVADTKKRPTAVYYKMTPYGTEIFTLLRQKFL